MECKLHDTVCRSVSLFLGVAIVGIASILEANWPLRWWAHSPARSAAGEPATVTSPHGDRQVQNWFRTTGSLRSLFDEGRDTFLITPTPTAWRPSFSIFSHSRDASSGEWAERAHLDMVQGSAQRTRILLHLLLRVLLNLCLPNPSHEIPNCGCYYHGYTNFFTPTAPPSGIWFSFSHSEILSYDPLLTGCTLNILKWWLVMSHVP